MILKIFKLTAIAYLFIGIVLFTGSLFAQGTAKDREMFQQLEIELSRGIAKQDLAEIHNVVESITQYKALIGLRAMIEPSTSLLIRGELAKEVNDFEKASFYLKQALKLSPLTFPILVEATPLIWYTNQSISKHIWNIVASMKYSPVESAVFLAKMISKAANLVLLAAFVLIVLSLLGRYNDFLEYVAKQLPEVGRGVLAPILLLLLLLIPLYFGPIIAIAAYAVSYSLICRQTTAPYVVAAALMFGGILQPLVNNINSWGEQRHFRRLVNMAYGYELVNKKVLEPYLDPNKISTPVSQYLAGVALKRSGKVGESEMVFRAVQGPFHSLAKAQLELISAIYDGASKDTNALSEMEQVNGSPEMLFNLSKLAFVGADIESSKRYMDRSIRANKSVSDMLRANEEVVGVNDTRSYAELYPSWWLFLSKLVFAAEQSAASQVKGLGVLAALVLGLVVVVAAAFSTTLIKQVNPYPLYKKISKPLIVQMFLRLVPGAASVAGDPLRSYLLMLVGGFGITLAGMWGSGIYTWIGLFGSVLYLMLLIFDDSRGEI